MALQANVNLGDDSLGGGVNTTTEKRPRMGEDKTFNVWNQYHLKLNKGCLGGLISKHRLP